MILPEKGDARRRDGRVIAAVPTGKVQQEPVIANHDVFRQGNCKQFWPVVLLRSLGNEWDLTMNMRFSQDSITDEPEHEANPIIDDVNAFSAMGQDVDELLENSQPQQVVFHFVDSEKYPDITRSYDEVEGNFPELLEVAKAYVAQKQDRI